MLFWWCTYQIPIPSHAPVNAGMDIGFCCNSDTDGLVGRYELWWDEDDVGWR